METMTLKNIRIVFMAFLVILFSLILTCCSDSNDFSNEIKTENELSVYDENNYDFTTINSVSYTHLTLPTNREV